MTSTQPWKNHSPVEAGRLAAALETGCRNCGRDRVPFIFFRADDVGVPGRRFGRLLHLFGRYRVPLCLAVVPAWLSRVRWQALQQMGGRNRGLWCWHQHGWRHVDHEKTGKKQEFGARRPLAVIKRDILAGRRRLERIIGADFFPVFTPPWNRCGRSTRQVLADLGFAAVSCGLGARSGSERMVPDLSVNVDLHTRRESTAASAWDGLFRELTAALASGRCGIMIHHQRMNHAAFAFIEHLLQHLTPRWDLRLGDFRDLIGTGASGSAGGRQA